MQKVLINKKKLMRHARTFKGEVEVEFPELREFLDVHDGRMPILKIKAATLDDQIRAQTLYEKAAVKAVKIIEGVRTKKLDLTNVVNATEMSEELWKPMNDKTFLEISIFKRCVIKPRFTMREVVLLSESVPEVVNRVAHAALKLSSMENLTNGD